MLITQNKALFVEEADRPQETALYTLKDYDFTKTYDDGTVKTYPSLSRRYVDMEDVGEFEFANKYFLNYEHWIRCTKAWFFKPYIKQWREELAAKLKSRAIAKIVAELDNPSSKNYYNALKFVHDAKWLVEEKKEARGRGRPASVHTPEDTSDIDKQRKQDYERILNDQSTILETKN